VWQAVAAALRDDDTGLSVDSSCVRATAAAAGAKKNGTAPAGRRPSRSLRSRGGFGTEIHAVVSPLGHPVVTELTGSEAADSPRLPGLIGDPESDAVLADKGYDPSANREAIRAAGAEPCIPPRRNRTEAIDHDRHLDQERNVAERYFARVKQYRRVATRYGEKAANFLGFVWGRLDRHHARLTHPAPVNTP